MTDKREGEELSSTARLMQTAAPWVAAVWKLVGGAVVGVLGGYFLDGWLGTKPWLMLGLSLVGMGVGFYAFFREVMRLGKK